MNPEHRKLTEIESKRVLNQIYGDTRICGIFFEAADILQKLDPLGFQEAMQQISDTWICTECRKKYEVEEDAEECCADPIQNKIYLISQDTNTNYDTYDSAIVCAASQEEARQIHPEGVHQIFPEKVGGTWCQPSQVQVEYIGQAAYHIKPGVVLASFNAG